MSIALDLALLLRDSSSNFNLSLATIAVAYTLAFRIGSNASTWVSQETLCIELNLCERSLKYHCASLKKSNLLLVKKDSKDRRKNVYSFNTKIIDYHAKKDHEKAKILKSLGEVYQEKVQSIAPNNEDRGNILHLNTCNKLHLISKNDHEIPSMKSPESELSTDAKGKKQRNIKSKETNISCSSDDERDSLFDEFWNAYPKKQSKLAAQKAWRKAIKIQTPENIIADVKIRSVNHEQWQNVKYVPMASTYLNGQQWTDDILTISKESTHARQQGIKGYAERLAEAAHKLNNTSFWQGKDNLG